jgi:DNA modification methylase
MNWPVDILVGDVRERLRELPADHFDCVVTSPPYWGLRDYGVEGQIGLEPTLGEHLAVMVEVFEEVKRVLKPTGTLWLNYGDCYATSPNGRSAADTKAAGGDDRTFRDKPFSTVGGVLKAKDLCMVPNRLAIALQEAGWWVRSEIIWAKPNPMPESIKDRPATSHEKIFLLSKRPRYFYDADAVRQPGAGDEMANGFRGGSYVNGQPGPRTVTGNYRRPNAAGKSPHGQGFSRKARAADVASPRHAGHVNHTSLAEVDRGFSRSLRNFEPAPVQVWQVATRPFKDAHFATFPPELAERCLKAGCPRGGRVLDPFGGAGTTALVGWRLGLSCTLIELNPEYAEITRRRLTDEQGIWADISVQGSAA